MAVRFRKSINIGGGVRINLSKSGAGISVGVPGARVGIGPRGVTRTLSVPGTGLSIQTVTSLGERTSDTPRRNQPLVFATQKTSSLADLPEPEAILAIVPRQSTGIAVPAAILVFGAVILGWSVSAGVVVLALGCVAVATVPRMKSTRSARALNTALDRVAAKALAEALPYAEEASTADPENGDAHCLAAMLNLLVTKDYGRVIGFAQERLRIRPDDLMTKVFLAGALFESGDFVEAIPLLEELLPTAPDLESCAELRLSLGKSHVELEEFEQAVSAFKKSPALSLSPPSHLSNDTRYWLGVSQLRCGRRKAAHECIRRVLEDDPNFTDAAGVARELSLRNDTVPK